MENGDYVFSWLKRKKTRKKTYDSNNISGKSHAILKSCSINMHEQWLSKQVIL